MTAIAMDPNKGVSVIVTSNPDAEIFLVRGDLQLAARGVGMLQTTLMPGIYKARVLRGGHIREQLFEAQDIPITLELFIDGLCASPSAGIEGYERLLRKLRPIERDKTDATGSITIIEQDTTGFSRAPFAKLRLYPWKQTANALHLTPVQTTERSVSVARADAERVTHVLEFRANGNIVRQLVPFLPQRNVRIYVRRSLSQALGSERTPYEWIDVEIQARASDVPYEGTRVFEERGLGSQRDLEYAARSALGHDRRIVVSAQGINQLLHLKFDDPLTGIAAAHLMFDALEKSARDKRRDRPAAETLPDPDFGSDFIDTVCKNLGFLCGAPDSVQTGVDLDPDLVAIWLRAGSLIDKDFTAAANARSALWIRAAMASDDGESLQIAIKRPPVFWRSWETLVSRAAVDRRIRIETDAWSRVKLSSAWGAYFVWRPHRLSVEKYLDAVARPVLESEAGRRRAESSTKASASPRRGLTGEAEVSISINDVARSMNIPLSVISG